ncbi:transketolase C-terminal domain-containing protein [Streptomyces olivoreticuli]|uniref:transketolase C-terminal domain-containing protein n=1 Tax=Streptomyces olivoreticuli TaxID=68246 RepID=UPI002659ABC5|nr:transketolase C-terminal domain-containing protein [Streptomyces olivoreticuli]WKK24008.1 transketolase C-terminal domain-containing protein [Streptomyces olivoreticuli]
MTVADPRWELHVHAALPELAARHRLTVSIEDGIRTGGIGSALTRACQDVGVSPPVTVLGLPQAFIPQGPRTALLAQAGLDGPGITQTVLRAFNGPQLHERSAGTGGTSEVGR